MADEFKNLRERLNQGGKGSNHKPNYRPVTMEGIPVGPANQNPPAKTREDDRNYKRQEDRGDAKRYKGWNSLIRIAGFCAAILGMYISAQFSVDGFSFSVDNRTWIGWGLAGILIVIQSAWQRFGDNLTIFAMAMVCYLYGITTNVLGILANRGGYDDNPMSLVVPLVFGILLEVFPEPFLAWSISGDITSDPLKKAVEKIG